MMTQILLQGFFLVASLEAAHGFTIADSNVRGRSSTFLQSAVEPRKLILEDTLATTSNSAVTVL